jgi:hypothetical protein
MFDTRIYRAGFLPTLAAVVVLMFSLEPIPEPLEEPTTTPAFSGREAARQARTMTTLAPAPTPGSSGDAALAGLVRERFEAVPGGDVSVQEVEGSFDGEDVTLRNVLLTFPGELEEAILVVAGRDSAEGSGATTSAAATATLLGLADDLGGARHRRTLVLASTSGVADGARGARELARALPESTPIEAAITIAAPGVPDPEPPFVVPGRAGPESISAGLIETVDEIAATQFEAPVEPPGAWSGFARLAIPVGIGEASALADEGLEAVAISAHGERPPPPEEDTEATLSPETLFAAGSSALETVLTLDEAAGEPSSGPDAYIRVSDNLLPGWGLALLAMALLLPALVAAADLWLRERRRTPKTARRSVPWALERALLPLAALLLIYGLAAVGLLPAPDFPYDPERFPPAAEGPIALVGLAIAVTLAALLVRPLRTPLDAEPQTLAAAAGLLCGGAVAGIWFLNPFLALLLVPTAHVWLLPARTEGPPRRRTIAIAGALALLPVVAAGIEVASALDLGLTAPWQLLLLFAGGHFGLFMGLLLCLLLGGLIACVSAAGGGVRFGPATPKASLRGPTGYAGPGSLGGTPSSLPRVPKRQA